MPLRKLRDRLLDLHCCYNRREFVHPDPLEFLYNYSDDRDREIVAFVASCLAYGSVWQILKNVSSVLEIMGSPRDFLSNGSRESLLESFSQFKYRFTTGEELATMLFGMKSVLDTHGSLQTCFLSHFEPDHETVVPALSSFVAELSSVFPERPRSLLPSPERGSACKRLNLFMRWMVRNDDVDPGGWANVPTSKLIVPVDVHMHRISLRLGVTNRKQANLRTAIEITQAFKQIEPEDPVRYDFCLTRLGIRDDADPEDFLAACAADCANR